MRKRKENESYEDYKISLKEEKEKIKKYLKGKIIWNNGTYRKANKKDVGHSI